MSGLWALRGVRDKPPTPPLPPNVEPFKKYTMAKTGGHFERCNVGSVEAHNERTRDYLEKVKASGLPLYFFQNLTANNTHWVNDRQEFAGKTCSQIFESLKQLYTEKTGQAPQLKDRTRINKKTGKEYTVAGWSPIREAVIPIKEDTTVEDFKPVFAWLRLNGLEPIRLDLHKDEGYKDEKTGETKMNYHAHLVVCWVDLQTGKTANLKKDKMSEFNQKVLPEALGMEAGESKNITGAKHLRPEEYKAMMDAKRQADEHVTAAKKQVQQLEEKQKNLKRENAELQVSNTTGKAVQAVGQSVLSMFGKSKQDKTIRQLQDTIAGERQRTAKAVADARADERQLVITEIKKAAKLRIGNDGKETAQDIGKAWRENFNGRNTLINNIEKLKEQHKNELGNREKFINNLQEKIEGKDNLIYQFWPEARNAVKAIFDLGSSSTSTDFPPQQALNVEKAIALSGIKRTDAALGLLDLAQKDFEKHNTPKAYIEGASKVVMSIAKGTHQRLTALLKQQSKDGGGGTSYITDLTDWPGNQIQR